eukprot:TRINITY_DN22967_c0_g1_i1.p1 TRINITY_DN22967_c0_g1~~TRINITY_DN22967_c0_g1_i1.p1  ORF type:complete len:107 (-),score=17.05 TRINITY_DN22967_c0_g1_i1:163-483(-)
MALPLPRYAAPPATRAVHHSLVELDDRTQGLLQFVFALLFGGTMLSLLCSWGLISRNSAACASSGAQQDCVELTFLLLGAYFCKGAPFSPAMERLSSTKLGLHEIW